MGAHITLNDTLQLTQEQGFPVELNLEKHLVSPIRFEDFKGKIFEFKNKYSSVSSSTCPEFFSGK